MAELNAEKRSIVGKHLRSLRAAGILPAVIYGEGVESTPLAIAQKDFEKIFREVGETSLVILKVAGGGEYNALIHDVAEDPMTLEPIHADFYAVRMDKPIEAKIRLVFIGESPAVKNEQGILVKVLHELEVKALPKDLPHEIAVDLSFLGHIEDKLYVSDISLPVGVFVLTNTQEVVALVEPPRSQVELEVAAAPAPTTPVAEVKTEREAKAETKQAEAEEEESGK